MEEVEEAPASPEVVAVHLESEPDGALVWMANQVLGRTAVTLEFEKDQLPQEIRFEKEGYVSETLEIAVLEDVDLAVSLEPQEDDGDEPSLQEDISDTEAYEPIAEDDPALPTVRRRAEAEEPAEDDEQAEEQAEESYDPVARYLGRGGDDEGDDEEESSQEAKPNEDGEADAEPATEDEDSEDEQEGEDDPDDLIRQML